MMIQTSVSVGEVELNTSCYSTLSEESAATGVGGITKEKAHDNEQENGSNARGRPRLATQQSTHVKSLVTMESLARLGSGTALEPRLLSSSIHDQELNTEGSATELAPMYADGPAMLKASLDLFMKNESLAWSAPPAENRSRGSLDALASGSHETLEMRTPTNTLKEDPPCSKGKDTCDGSSLSVAQEHNDIDTARLFEDYQGPNGDEVEQSAERCFSPRGNNSPVSKERITIRDRVPTPLPHAAESEQSHKSGETSSGSLVEETDFHPAAQQVSDWSRRNDEHDHDQPFRQFFARLKIAVRRRHEKTLHRAKTFKTMITVRAPQEKRNSAFSNSFYSGLGANTRPRSKSKHASFQDALSIFEDNASNEFQLNLDSLCSSRINLTLDFSLDDAEMLEACESQAQAQALVKLHAQSMADKLYPWKTRTCSSEIGATTATSAEEPQKSEYGKRNGLVGSITSFWPGKGSRSSERAPTTSSSVNVFGDLDAACNI